MIANKLLNITQYIKNYMYTFQITIRLKLIPLHLYVTIIGKKIEQVSTFKFLGVFVDEHLPLTKHDNYLLDKL